MSIKTRLQKWFPKTFKPSWKDCSRASCWEGSNAQTRHMNILSPKFSLEKAKQRLTWAKQRGCNCVHLFLCNKGDGEGSGYSIYGTTPNVGHPDKATVAVFEKRVKYARKLGLGVVFWLLADDSTDWNRALAKNADGYLRDLKGTGLLDYASTIVLGLELDEWAGRSEVAALSAACRNHAKGIKTGVHHTSGKGQFAELADILFWQVSPGRSVSQIRQDTKGALAFGKPLNMFEIARYPVRELAQACIDAGAFGVGNW